MPIPALRLRAVNARSVHPDGEFVLYWMIAARRTRSNFALQHAASEAARCGRPLVILEALRCDYPYASARLHRFILDGMADNARALAGRPATYHPYVEPEPGAGRGLLAALAERACLVVTDDFPAFFLPQMVAAAGAKLPVRLVAVDGNGLLPLQAADHAYPTAYAFRRFLQKTLPEQLANSPATDPLSRLPLIPPTPLPRTITERWPAADPLLLYGVPEPLAALPIDHGVPPAPLTGGHTAAHDRLSRFVGQKLARYAEERNHPDLDATSGLSPYLHFGHISVYEIFQAVTNHEEWVPPDLSPRADGRREGWWGMSASAEAFLDQLITWRELGFNNCAHRSDVFELTSLPAWARHTLAEHADDPRQYCYSLDEFRNAATHDPVWNAAQRQLRREGTIHNYLRMLWGKKILEWSPTPQDALATMIELNDRYALDGRDPNSYAGILWCLGRHDRAWGPIRPVFGSVRYMSSENTKRKVQMAKYLERYRE
ncbi:MAG: deoxyribodipyrimidine photolyase [Desulfuromonadales bacterium]